jgi:tetratricopeptide (TPR) repeat protein
MRFLPVVLAWCAISAAPLSAQKLTLAASLPDLEAAARRDSNDAAAHYNVGVGYFASHRYDDAEQSLRKALAIEPRFADAWLALSIIRDNDEDFWKHVKKERGDSAVRQTAEEYGRYYRRAFLIDPLVDMRILAPTIRVYGSGDLYKGYKALVEGRYDEAQERLAKASEYYDGAIGARGGDWLMWLSAMAAARADKPDVAIADLDTLIQHVDSRQGQADTSGFDELDGVEMRQVVAALKQRAGQTDEAIAMYQEVLARDIGNYMSHVQLANIYESRREFDRAIAERQRALDTNPDDASLLLDLGITLGKAGRYAEAARQLASAVQRNPRDTRSLFWLGMAQQQAGDRDAARTAYASFIAAAPSRFDRQIQLAHQHLGELQ